MFYIVSGTVRVWDIRPFAPKERCVKIFQGHVHNFEKVSPIIRLPELFIIREIISTVFAVKCVF